MLTADGQFRRQACSKGQGPNLCRPVAPGLTEDTGIRPFPACDVALTRSGSCSLPMAKQRQAHRAGAGNGLSPVSEKARPAVRWLWARPAGMAAHVCSRRNGVPVSCHVMNRIGQYLQAVLAGPPGARPRQRGSGCRPPRCEASPPWSCGPAAKAIGKIVRRQPLAALGTGHWGWEKHLTDAAIGTAAETRGMANGRNQGSPDSQFLHAPRGHPDCAATPPSTEFSTAPTACITVAV